MGSMLTLLRICKYPPPPLLMDIIPYFFVNLSPNFHRKTGVLILDGPPYKEYRKYLRGVQAVSTPYETFTASELKQRYPGALQFDDNVKGMLELDAGLLRADKALKSLQVGPIFFSFPFRLGWMRGKS